jgi:hypothetical protein
MSFFASDSKYLQRDERVGFASDMSEHYRFLFSDALAPDYMVSRSFNLSSYACITDVLIGLVGDVSRPSLFASFCITFQRDCLPPYYPGVWL